MPTYSFHPSLYVYFKKSQMNKLVVTFSTPIMKTTPTELETSELMEGLLFCFWKHNEFAPKKKEFGEENLFMNWLAENVGKYFKLWKYFHLTVSFLLRQMLFTSKWHLQHRIVQWAAGVGKNKIETIWVEKLLSKPKAKWTFSFEIEQNKSMISLIILCIFCFSH